MSLADKQEEYRNPLSEIKGGKTVAVRYTNTTNEPIRRYINIKNTEPYIKEVQKNHPGAECWVEEPDADGFQSRNVTVHIEGKNVTCMKCAHNYDSRMNPCYCQEFNKPIDTMSDAENHKLALGCRYFLPVKLLRQQRYTPVAKN